ncbi:hypothetical protein MPDQ_002076 [Monascus purpureus]|uniref:Uncharacterized protein n=1 Tax=Monascus purpureus TaxID=5098 RepID=A0A507QQG6_MONPU|nr:hypothetical protein MPDQ_002076 [Monascus purpureus]
MQHSCFLLAAGVPQISLFKLVFGDSWSDINSGEVRVWTDLLCDSFSCHHENLAQTAQFSAGDFVGSVVDNSEVELPEDVREWQVADFKGQVKRWIAAEQEIIQDLSEKEIRKRKNNTITVVSFGLWDLWFLVDKDYNKATKSIDHKLDVIMEQMDLLSETLAGNETKVILTLPVDVSFLPAFEPKSVDRQKNAVQIVEYWNNNLREAARKWNNGVIYLFDTSAFMADLVRDRQLFAAGIVQTSGLGKNENPGWENVQDPCVSRGKSWMMYRSERCAKPEKYLFWDEKSVGPSFHRLMATEIFDGISNLWLGQQNAGLLNGTLPVRPRQSKRPHGEAESQARGCLDMTLILLQTACATTRTQQPETALQGAGRSREIFSATLLRHSFVERHSPQALHRNLEDLNM